MARLHRRRFPGPPKVYVVNVLFTLRPLAAATLDPAYCKSGRTRMALEMNKARSLLSGLVVIALFALCGILGILQYRWTGEVSVAERERLRGILQASLTRFSQDFNSEVAAACRELLPSDSPSDAQSAEKTISALWPEWKRNGRETAIFRRVAIVAPRQATVVLRGLDLDRGVFGEIEWPAEWANLRGRIESRLSPQPQQGRGFRGFPPPEDGTVFELDFRGGPPAGGGFQPPGQAGALLVELDPDYIRSVLLPDALKRHLGAGGSLDYEAEVLTETNPPSIVYRSDPDEPKGVAGSADASVGFFALQFDSPFAFGGGARGRGRGPGDMRDQGQGRGQRRRLRTLAVVVRHRAGSLEAVVYRSRMRNLAVTSGVLLLMFASLAALVRFTRRSQKLAELQMEFVAGVSHELWTPLTVISTAGYNLRGKMSRDPAQVERYGALIQRESGRLKDLVEQVLRFAGVNAGRAVGEFQPLSADAMIADALESSRFAVETSQCTVEKTIEPGLPLVLGDPIALKHALSNLIANAAKYGTSESKWIGVFASKTTVRNAAQLEIRIVDRGPGIPADEQRRVFDPFFRGKRALRDQIHGTGLGLSLVKRIVEAHGGTIGVRSDPAKGTEFVVRLPIAAPEYQDEFAHTSG